MSRKVPKSQSDFWWEALEWSMLVAGLGLILQGTYLLVYLSMRGFP